MFIELTYLGDMKITVNINKIIAYSRNGKDENGTVINFGMDDYITVYESYEQVKKLIKDEILAERGYAG